MSLLIAEGHFVETKVKPYTLFAAKVAKKSITGQPYTYHVAQHNALCE